MHQYLFYIGDFPIRAYGVVISLSILLATGVGYFLAKTDGRGYENTSRTSASTAASQGFSARAFGTCSSLTGTTTGITSPSC